MAMYALIALFSHERGASQCKGTRLAPSLETIDAHASAQKAWHDLLHNADLTMAIGKALQKRLATVLTDWPPAGRTMLE